jgi:Antitoxin-like ribbon-helix-helix
LRPAVPGKRIQFDQESWAALDLLARDRMMTFQELAEEALRDLLRKYGRPTGLKEALRKSVGASTKVVKFKRRKKTKAKRRL